MPLFIVTCVVCLIVLYKETKRWWKAEIEWKKFLSVKKD